MRLYNFLLRSFYISLQQALEIIENNSVDYDLLRWDVINVTRRDYYYHQLTNSVESFYGYRRLYNGIDEHDKLEIISSKHLPKWSNGYTKWNDHYSVIVISKTCELFYVGICISKKDLRRFLKNKDKKTKEGINNIFANIKKKSIKKLVQDLISKLKLFFQKK